jgi:hypothetical protein
MKILIEAIIKKLNEIIWTFASTGVILVVLAILAAWNDFMLRLIVGLMVLLIAYAFLNVSLKFWFLKKDIEKHFNSRK